jgi:hypothetical protein
MIDWYTLLIPIAVSAVLLLFRFVGCTFSEPFIFQAYETDVLHDQPVRFYPMGDTAGSTTAFDETHHLDGRYGDAGPFLLSGTDAATYLSLPIATPSIEVGAPQVAPNLTGTSVRLNGGFLSAQGPPPISGLERFTVEALVHPEWDIVNQRNFYCVVDYSNFVPGLGAPGPNRNTGFAIYAGPDNPSDLTSPVCWQLWLGTGRDTTGRGEFARAFPATGPGPLVLAEDTYLAVQFGDTQAFLWAFTVKADMNLVKFEVQHLPYVQATDPDPSKLVLRVGLSGNFAGLIPPFPSPAGHVIYPFVGRIAEVAVYDTVFDPGRLMSHVVNAFNTT